MSAIYRHFPLFLFLAWLTATGAVFVGTVWGRLDSFFVASWETSRQVAQMIEREGRRVAQNLWNLDNAAEPSTPDGKTDDPVPTPADDALDVRELSTRLVPGNIPDPPERMLENLRFEREENRWELVLKTDRRIETIYWFHMSDPPLTAIDLMGSWGTNLPERIAQQSGPVNRIVLGEHHDRLRVSLLYKKGPQPKHTPSFMRIPGGIKVTFDLD